MVALMVAQKGVFMREYSDGTVQKKRGKWQGLVKYRELSDETDPKTGKPLHGKWQQLAKTFDVKSRPGINDNTGRATAEKLLKEWRDSLVKGEEERCRLEEERRQREDPAHPHQTVTEYVARFIDENAASVEASTTSGYRKLLRQMIAPRIGDVPLDELNPDAVSAWLQDLLKEYQPVTARKALMLLRSAMKQAVERDVLAKDPTRTVKVPKYSKGEPNALDELGRGRVVSFVDIDPTDPVSLGIRIAMYTGLREGEVCALRWKNVDMKAATLRVCESIGRADKGDIPEKDRGSATYAGLYIKEPKNKGSIRTVSYPEDLAQVLERRRAEVREQCMEAGVPFSPEMFVIGSIDGAPMHPHTLNWRWRAVVTALGLVGTQGKPPTFHDLRHTYATAAVAYGIDVKTIQNSMGHANAAMTLNTYATADPDAARRAAEVMGQSFKADAERARERGRVIEFPPTGTESH